TEAYYPFLTVILEPAYEMGMNAAQLLFSRLDAEEDLQPRQVVLPTRLTIRYSCGSRLKEDGDSGPCLSIPEDIQSQTVLVKPLSAEEQSKFAACIKGVVGPTVTRSTRLSDDDRPNVNRLLKVLQHRQADRLPHLEFQITSQSIFEYVLGRALGYGNNADASVSDQAISPKDHVEFARRIGMDAVTCNFSWRPNNVFQKSPDGTEKYIGGSVKTWTDLDHLDSPPSRADQLSTLERYLQAAQGTGVGVVASFTSFFDSAMLAVGMSDALDLFHSDRRFLETLMDILLEHQEKVVRAVCDRFAEDLAFISISDHVANDAGLIIDPDMFGEIFPDRMQRLVSPAKEHGKPVVMNAGGRIEDVLPTLFDIGFDAVHLVEPEVDRILELKQQWAGKVALTGGFPTRLLIRGSRDEIEERVREYCLKLAPGGSYVFGCSTPITESVPPENFVTMAKAVHKYGRYRSSGDEA
ncbi:MAG: hypothetical protein JSU96_05110, partial [Acidobacteriota bacterium]